MINQTIGIIEFPPKSQVRVTISEILPKRKDNEDTTKTKIYFHIRWWFKYKNKNGNDEWNASSKGVGLEIGLFEQVKPLLNKLAIEIERIKNTSPTNNIIGNL